MSRLSPSQRLALDLAHAGALTGPVGGPHGVRGRTIRALLRRGLLELGRSWLYVPTSAGLVAREDGHDRRAQPIAARARKHRQLRSRAS